MEVNLLQIEPTRNCNLGCKTCTRESGNQNISVTTLNNICNQFDKISCIKLQGLGEPLLHPHLKLLIDVAHTYSEYVLITTNGTIPFYNLSNCRGITNVTVSVNTLNRQKYIDLTGKDLLETVLRNIDDALNCGVHVFFNIVLSPYNTPEEVNDIIEYATDRDISCSIVPMEIWYGKSHQKFNEQMEMIHESRRIHNHYGMHKRQENCEWTLENLYYDYLGRLHPCCIRMTDEYILNDVSELDCEDCCSVCF